MSDLACWIPRMLPSEGEGLTMRRLKARLEGRTGDRLDSSNVRKAVHRAMLRGDVRVEVERGPKGPQFILWRRA